MVNRVTDVWWAYIYMRYWYIFITVYAECSCHFKRFHLTRWIPPSYNLPLLRPKIPNKSPNYSLHVKTKLQTFHRRVLCPAIRKTFFFSKTFQNQIQIPKLVRSSEIVKSLSSFNRFLVHRRWSLVEVRRSKVGGRWSKVEGRRLI